MWDGAEILRDIPVEKLYLRLDQIINHDIQWLLLWKQMNCALKIAMYSGFKNIPYFNVSGILRLRNQISGRDFSIFRSKIYSRTLKSQSAILFIHSIFAYS